MQLETLVNFFKETPSITTVIPSSIAQFCQTATMDSPCIIILRMASIYQRAGTIFDTNLKKTGRFSIGNNIPDSIRIGIIITIAETRSATICVLAIVETSSPNDRDNTRYKIDNAKIPATPPSIGIPNKYWAKDESSLTPRAATMPMLFFTGNVVLISLLITFIV